MLLPKWDPLKGKEAYSGEFSEIKRELAVGYRRI